MPLTLSYKCLGDLRNPYNVRLRRQNSADSASGSPLGGLDNDYLVVWKEGVAECVFAISLLEGAPALDELKLQKTA